MRRIALAAAATCTLAAAAGGPALAGVAHPATTKVFSSTLRPNSNVKSGTTMKMVSSHAKKRTNYTCVLIVIKGATYGAYTGSIKGVKSTSTGHVTCKQTFKPYITNYGKTGLKCPTTRAERKAGYSCAVSLADTATSGQTSASVAKFTARR